METALCLDQASKIPKQKATHYELVKVLYLCHGLFPQGLIMSDSFGFEGSFATDRSTKSKQKMSRAGVAERQHRKPGQRRWRFL